MPIPAVIDGAAQSYRYNDKFLVDCVQGLSVEEWHRRPSECTNHMAWLVGHLVWARKSVLARLGAEWTAPWLGLYARGAKVDPSAACPSPADLLSAWSEVSKLLGKALENASEEGPFAAGNAGAAQR